MISTADGEMLVELDAQAPSYRRLRARPPAATFRRGFPNSEFFFLPADISTRCCSTNFGLSAPIDVRLVGPPQNQAQNASIGRELVHLIAAVPGAVDVHLNQVTRDAGAARQHRPDARFGGRAHDPAGGERRPGLALLERADVAQLLARPEERGAIPRRRTDASQYRVDSIDALQATPLGRAALQEDSLSSSPTWPPSRGSPGRRTSRTTTSAPPSTCSRTSTGRRPGSRCPRPCSGSSTEMRSPSAGHDHLGGRAAPEHARFISRAGPGSRLRGGARLRAHGRQLPVSGWTRSSS